MKKTKFCEQKHKNNYFQKAGGGAFAPPKMTSLERRQKNDRDTLKYHEHLEVS